MTLDSLGDYKIIKELGSGGMGVVYLAEHQRLKKKYALKVISKEFAQDKQLIERFHTEARVMAELNHPNIVKVVNMSCEGTTYYLVMDYVESETGSPKNLHDYTREQGGKVPEAKAERITLDILSALEYAHSYSSAAAPKGIIHRDIKPANVLLDENGKAKVTDFGLVKIIAGNKQSIAKRATLTVEGSILGTYDFMSPEQKEGKPVDARSDIYAAGVIIYSMLTGKKPEGRFNLPSEIDPGISKKWDTVVDRCLQNLPENRFQSVADVIKEIKSKKTKKQKKTKKITKEKKPRRGWFVELIRWSALIIIVAIIVSAILAYVVFKDKDFINTLKSSITSARKEKTKTNGKKPQESPQTKSVPDEERGEHNIRLKAQEGKIQIVPGIKSGAELPKIPIKILDLEKLKGENLLDALKVTGTAKIIEGLQAGSKEFSEYYKSTSDKEKVILKYLVSAGIGLIKLDKETPTVSSKDLTEVMESIKKAIPPESPQMKNWEEAIKKIKEGEKHIAKGNHTKSQKSYNEAQEEMRKYYLSNLIIQEVVQAKKTMNYVKNKVGEAQSGAIENVLYRAAAKAEKDADYFFQNHNYSDAKTLYAVATSIFSLSAACIDSEDCIKVLQKFVENAKARADKMNASSIASELYDQATQAEKKGNSFFRKESFKDAADSYIKSAFYYEKAIRKAEITTSQKYKDR